MRLLIAAVLAVLPFNSLAQSPSPSLSLSLTTSSVTVTTTTRTRNQNSAVVTVVPTIFNVTYTVAPTPSSSASSTSASASPSSAPIVLDTKLDPAFGVLGAILIITGLPSAFWGHKNRWTSFFLIGFYTLSLVCIVLILKFGVLPSVNPPSKTVRGMFVLSSVIAGSAGGAIAIFFWKAARYGIGGWGGFALALWIQCFHNGGLIKPVAFRWILYIGCAVVGFVLCTIPKIHYHVLLISTAFVGSSVFMLGVDCYTTAGLKEFYVWNIGFRSLFPKFTNNGIEFPVSQTMQIELGLIAAVALMGVAVQLRILSVLERKLKEIAEEQKKRDEEAEIQATDRFAAVLRERDDWEKEHSGRYGRYESGYSSMPLMKDQDGSSSPATGEHRSSDFTLNNEARVRHHSGLSEFMSAPTPDEELRRAARNLQTPGALPALDLGLGIQDDVPPSFMAKELSKHNLTPQESEEFKKKEELVAEIQTIRRSIDALKSETPAPSSSGGSRRPSMTSRRTLSIDATSALLPPQNHLRPPREADPRARVRSMDIGNLAQSLGESISRPTSVPLQDGWDNYLQDRKLLQPPAGISPPIATTSFSAPPTSSRIPIPPAVAAALNQRKQRESALVGGEPGTDSSEDVPLAKIHRRKRSSSTGGNIPVTVLPPKRAPPIVAPTPQRANTRTFEELTERHREKMRDLQRPLTTAERENADLETAKQRWERSKALEKEAVTKRQAEKAAMLEKRKRSEDDQERPGRKSLGAERSRNARHSRSLSADKLGNPPNASKRLSTMKVEDWKKYQQEVDAKPSGGRRDSRAPVNADVPFPDRSSSAHRRKSRDNLS
ncbi:hypothetical protein C8J56DRAFT_1021331 [Mycena floridula]|nr:hypothetical protein C8J56DRAFT_1021331 [Mycena floridula]